MSAHAADDAPSASDAFDAGPAAVARAALVREIGASGVWQDDPSWRAAFAAVPRHLFVPYYFVGTARGCVRLWGEDPDPGRRAEWLRGVYTDEPLATRVREGELVSSSSQPSLMARMLADLHVRDGDAVLEIGAGTGYNAALLAHRLGDDHVTTIDLDPEITETARAHLAAAGYHPAVVTGDGARGCLEHAPYDRIIATCALGDMPRAWLAQCRPGARIVAPFATGLIALEVYGGVRAQGRFLPTPAYFVPLRGTGRDGLRHAQGPPAPPEPSPWGTDCRSRLPRGAIGEDSFRFLLVLTDGRLDPRDAVALWDRTGRPERDRYGITVDGERAWAWLDDPDGAWSWPL